MPHGKNVIHRIHDGMQFFFSPESARFEFVGFYFDHDNICRPIHAQSIYGQHIMAWLGIETDDSGMPII